MEAIHFDDFQYYTYSDYQEWDGSWELIEGIPYAMAPAPYPLHQKIVFSLAKELDEHLECANCSVYLSPVDWKIDESNVVQPDLALFCERPDKQYFSKTPPLVIEVLSKSTALKDVTTKYRLYEKQGVKYYVIVEPNTQVADIFMLENNAYVLQKKVTKENSYIFDIFDACTSEIDFSKVFED